jgi:hypothetical protein
LRALLTLSGSTRSRQALPWLRLDNKLHWPELRDGGPYVYWYRLPEVCTLLETQGFRLRAIGSSLQISQGSVAPDYASLSGQPLRDRLYAVCTRN